MVTKEYFDTHFSYDPETGIIVRKTKPCNSVKIGQQAGFLQRRGPWLKYRAVEILGKTYLAHRLAFLAMTGELPEDDIDHIDGNGLNNAWVNLRCVDAETNSKNRKMNHNNTSGCLGVSYFKQTNKWRAAINIGKIKKHIGYFNSKQEAISARQRYEREHGYHENHGRMTA